MTTNWDGRVFYGICFFWTDDWSVMRTTPGGIPCCPHCGSVGFEERFKKWMENVADYDKQEPGYLNFIVWAKGRCFRNVDQARAAYATVKQ